MSGSCAGASLEPVRRFEVFTGEGRRRRWSLEEKLAIVAEMSAVDNVSDLARRHGLRASQLFTWRRELRYAAEAAAQPAFVPAVRTTAPVLDPGRGRTKTGQLWAYARDDRPWGGADPPAVVYLYAPDRKAERPIEHLAGFRGTLQVDGYGGYGALARRGEIQLAFCWAHVRRRFFELASAGSSPVSTDVLGYIAKLYTIDAEVRGRSPNERLAARQEYSRPIVEELRWFLDAKLAQISRKSTLAEAIRYALTRWDGLTRFLEDGHVELDSNIVERAIRPLALNRKNALFAGSDDGGDHWSVIASLIETAKLNRIDPQLWLTDILSKLAAGHGARHLSELMPWNHRTAVV